MRKLDIDYSKLTKLYYSIGELSKLFDVNASLIRFWEKELNLATPKKNKKGNRLFTVKDIQTLGRVYQLVKIEGYKLEAAKRQLKVKKSNPKSSSPNNKEILNKLEKIKARLIEMKSN